MRADAGLHADPTRRQIAQSGPHLATRPLLPQHDGTALILANDCGTSSCRYRCRLRRAKCRVSVTWRALCLRCSLPAFVAGREHGRTIPLADFRESRPVVPAWNPVCCTWVTDFFVKFCMLKERHILDSRECWSFFDEEVSAGCGWSCCTGDGGSRL